MVILLAMESRILTVLILSGILCNSYTTQGVQLSPEYSVNWDYDVENGNITFEVIVETRGFIGFGISPTGSMAFADIIVGGLHSNGTAYFADYHGTGNEAPILDESQDWFLISARENKTHTTLKFWRVLETCDDNDLAISMETQKLIWSWGTTDVLQYHGVNRGTKNSNLLDPTLIPPDLSKYEVWDMFNRISVPPKQTTYWCSIHKSPNFTGQHHLVGFDSFLPNDTALRHTHHIDLYSCNAPNPTEVFEKWIGDEGTDCYERDPDKPDFPANYCVLLELGWAVGGQPIMFPNHTGYNLQPNSYWMMEVHYNNPDSLDGLNYETGLYIYYTDQLREYDAGYFLVGSTISYTQMIPPNSPNFTQVAHCSPWCTQHFPEAGLNVFAFFFHAHTSARSMKFRIFRDGQEIPWPIWDAHYDFGYQQNRILRQEFQLLPGDHLSTECIYDTTWKEGEATIGGRSTREEMCMTYLFYYPNIPDVVLCNSELPNEKLLQFLGVESVVMETEWQEDPTVTAPEEFAGMSLTQVIQGMNWTTELRERYQELHRYEDHEIECFPKTEDRGVASYPNVPDWVPEDNCVNN